MNLCAGAVIAVKKAAKSTVDYRTGADAHHNALWVEDYYKEILASGFTRWYSYAYWRREPFQGAYINVDDKGLRRTWNSKECGDESDSGCLKIFMFGGSTMWGSGSRDDNTISSVVSRLLSEKGVKVRVTNFGETGYVSSQELIALLRELQNGNVPDMVVFYDGINDTCASIQSGEAGIPMNEFNREKEFNILAPYNKFSLYKEAGLSVIKESPLYRLFDYAFKKIMSGNRTVIHDAQPRALEIKTDLDKLADSVVRVYGSNIKFAKQLAADYGFKTLFYWQPAVFTKKNLTPYEKERAIDEERVKDYFSLVYEKARKSLSQTDSFRNISDIFGEDQQPYFTDFAHLSEEGDAIIARRIFEDAYRLYDSVRK